MYLQEYKYTKNIYVQNTSGRMDNKLIALMHWGEKLDG